VLLIRSRGVAGYTTPLLKGYFANLGVAFGCSTQANSIGTKSGPVLPVGLMTCYRSTDGNSLIIKVRTGESEYKTVTLAWDGA